MTAITSIHIEQIIALLEAENPSSELHMKNGLFVYRSYEYCHFSYDLNLPELHSSRLAIPGKVYTPIGSIEARYSDRVERIEETSAQIILDASFVPEPIIVRKRKAGDRIEARGMQGTKKTESDFY